MTRTDQTAQPTVVHGPKVDGRVASSPHEQRHARSRVGRRGWIALGATAVAPTAIRPRRPMRAQPRRCLSGLDATRPSTLMS